MHELRKEHIEAYAKAGLSITPLYPILDNGQCGCQDPECPAAGKHPMVSAWQSTIGTSNGYKLVETYINHGLDCTGFGWVIGPDHLVVDVDPKNGGEESYKKLLEICPELEECNVAARTGGGGFHLYYKKPAGVRTAGRLADYPGIDFKALGGFVVGAGSIHKSGKVYDLQHGYSTDPSEMDYAPQCLLDILQKTHKQISSGCDFDTGRIEEMLACISPDCEYDEWRNVGMAIHHETEGQGLSIWDSWSAKGKKYEDGCTEKRWFGFGKSATVVTGATLARYAMDNGWKPPAGCVVNVPDDWTPPSATKEIDLNNPPGLVGDIVRQMNKTAIRERPALAVGAALWAVGSVMGKMYIGPNGARPNFLVMGIAASGSGKNHIYNVARSVINAATIGELEYGSITSDTELLRNIYQHQTAIYSIDEIHRIFNAASGQNAAAYMRGVPDAIMTLFTESCLKLRGNDKAQLIEQLSKKIGVLEGQYTDCPDEERGFMKARIDWEKKKLVYGESGVPNPFLSIIGVSTPNKMEDFVNTDTMNSGLISRCLIFREYVDTPPKCSYGPAAPKNDTSLPSGLSERVLNIYKTGRARDTLHTWTDRLGHEFWGEPMPVKCSPEAVALLTEADKEFDHLYQTCTPDLQSVTSRAYEAACKIAMVLACEDCIITEEMAAYAVAMVKKDLGIKRQMMTVSIGQEKGANETERTHALYTLIGQTCDTDKGATISVIRRKAKKYREDDVANAIDLLVEKGALEKVEKSAGKGRPSIRYKKLA